MFVVRLAAKLPKVMHFSRTGGAFVADSKWEINTTESPDNDLSHFGRRKPHGGIWTPTAGKFLGCLQFQFFCQNLRWLLM